MPHLDTQQGARIFYETWGDPGRPWVTLVNGFTRAHTDFAGMARHLAREGFRVLAADSRGVGKTETGAPFTLADLAADLRALWDGVGADTSFLLGISFGGAVAVTAASAFADRVRGLVLVSTVPRWRGTAQWEEFFAMPEAEREVALSRYFSEAFARDQAPLFRMLRRELAKSFSDPVRASRARAQLSAIEGFDAAALLPALRVPTLVIHGDDDRVAPPEGAEEIAGAVAGARLELIPGVGHLLLAEAPLKLYDLATRFFRGLEASA